MNKPSAAAMRAAKLLCYTNHTSLVRSTAARIIDAEFAQVVEAERRVVEEVQTHQWASEENALKDLKAVMSKMNTPEGEG